MSKQLRAKVSEFLNVKRIDAKLKTPRTFKSEVKMSESLLYTSYS